MSLDTQTDVEQVRKVQDENGDQQAPANQAEQAETNDKLGNADSAFSNEVTPATGGETLPSHSVKDGQEVLLLADPANSGIIYVGPNGSPSVPLSKGNGVTLSVTNTDLLDAQASETGQTLHIIGEGGA